MGIPCPVLFNTGAPIDEGPRVASMRGAAGQVNVVNR